MKPDWNRHFAAGLLAILLCLCSFSMPAFASGSDPAPEPMPETIEEEPTTGGMEPLGVPITPKGNATLVDDFYGDKHPRPGGRPVDSGHPGGARGRQLPDGQVA